MYIISANADEYVTERVDNRDVWRDRFMNCLLTDWPEYAKPFSSIAAAEAYIRNRWGANSPQYKKTKILERRVSWNPVSDSSRQLRSIK